MNTTKIAYSMLTKGANGKDTAVYTTYDNAAVIAKLLIAVPDTIMGEHFELDAPISNGYGGLFCLSLCPDLDNSVWCEHARREGGSIAKTDCCVAYLDKECISEGEEGEYLLNPESCNVKFV